MTSTETTMTPVIRVGSVDPGTFPWMMGNRIIESGIASLGNAPSDGGGTTEPFGNTIIRDIIDPNPSVIAPAPTPPVEVQGLLTNVNQPTLVGTATPLTKVTVSADGVAVGSVMVDASGDWRFALPEQSDGVHVYKALAMNAAGTYKTASTTLTIDTTPSAVPAVDSVVDNVAPITGPLKSGDVTDDAAPVISGKGATPGDQVKVYDGEAYLGSATVDASGNWSYKPATPLADGAHHLQASSVDPAHNESAKSVAFDISVDTTVPTEAVKISAIHDDTGVSATDFITMDNTLLVDATVTGTLKATERVQISLDGGTTWHETTAQDGGVYQFDNQSTQLPDGEYHFQARVINQAGSAGTADDQLVVIDNAAPDGSVAITAYLDNVPPVTGEFGSGSFTDDTTPLLEGTVTGLETGQVIRISGDGQYIGDATVDGDTWNYQLPETNAGPHTYTTHTYTAQIFSAAGDAGTKSNDFTLTEDLRTSSDLGTVQITDEVNNTPTLTGKLTSGSYTNDSGPVIEGTVTGTMMADDVVEIFDNNQLLGTATMVTENSWTYKTNGLADGVHTITGEVYDEVGVDGALSPAFSFTVDTIAPDKQAFSAADSIGTITGPIGPNDSTTDDARPVFSGSSGSSEAGSTVTIYDGASNILGTATVQSDGSWSFKPATDMSEGAHSITVKETDQATNTGVSSDALVFTTDTSAEDLMITGVQAHDGSSVTFGSVSGLGTGNTALLVTKALHQSASGMAANGAGDVTPMPLNSGGNDLAALLASHQFDVHHG